jgi:hypothetical protein
MLWASVLDRLFISRLMNIWSVIVADFNCWHIWLGHVIGALFGEHCCDIWPSFDENVLTFVKWWVVNDDLMFSWYCIFPFSDLRNVVWCLIVEFFISSNFLSSLILLNKCDVLDSFSLMSIVVKLKFKVEFCRKCHLFWILNVVGLTFSFL